MPRVPRAQEQVQEAALPGGKLNTGAPLDAFGGGQAAAGAATSARSLGQELNTYVADERNAADAVVIQNADLETAREKLRLLKAPGTGALSIQGQETLGLPDSVGGAFSKYTDGVKKNLTAGQRNAYDRLVLGHRRDIDETLGSHIFSEMRKFDDSTTSARIQTAREEATLNFNDPKKVAQNIEQQKQLLRARADRSGLAGTSIPPEELAIQLADASSKTQTAVVSRMLIAGNDQQARAYYETIKQDLTSADAVQLEKAMRQSTVLGESQRHASTIMQKAKGEGAALEQARELKDPDVQKATVDEIRTRYAEQKRLEKGEAEQAMQDASTIVEQTRDARAVPRALWAQLPINERHALENRSRQLREGVEPVTDWSLYYSLKTRASSPATREGFLQENLYLYRAELDDASFKELTGLQASERRGGDEASRKELDGYRTSSEIVNTGLNAIGIDPTPKPGSKDAQKVASFRNLVDNRIRAEQRRTGKQASTQDVQAIVDDLVIKAKIPNATLGGVPIPFTGSTIRAYEAMALKKSDIPGIEIHKLEAALKRAGRPASDGEVIDAYNALVRKRLNGG